MPSVARLDEATRVLAGSFLWAALLLVTYLWSRDGGVSDLRTSFATLTMSVGRLSGLWSAVLLLAQVLLIARLPLLERSFGQDELLRLHRLVGFTSFNLMLTHLVFITWGYASGQLTRVPGTFWDLTVNYPGMLLALAGTACLVMTAVTSVKAARRKLRYESWHLLHLYAYLGVGLALPHQLWTGQEFLRSTAATVFWWSAWAATAAAVVVWRVGVPVTRNLRHQLRVESVVREAPGVHSVYVTGRDLGRLNVTAGQFLNWRFLDRAGWTRGNPYSISAAPDGRRLRVTVKTLGDNSRQVKLVRPGTRVWFEGPYGRLTHRPRTRRRLAFIGAGVGVTPLRALAEALDYAPGEAVLFHRYTTQPLFASEFRALEHSRGLQIVELVGKRRGPDSWAGSNVRGGDDLAMMRYLVPDLAERDVYVCGPEAWTAAVIRTAQAAGVPATQIHVENFAW